MNIHEPALNDVPQGNPDPPSRAPRQCPDPHCRCFLPAIEKWTFELDDAVGAAAWLVNCPRCGDLVVQPA